MRRGVLVTGARDGIAAATRRCVRGEAWYVVGLALGSSVDASASPPADFMRSRQLVEAVHTVPRRRLLAQAASTIGPVVPLPLATAIRERSRRVPSSLTGRRLRVGAL
jgi:hypothetical protein